MPDVFYVCCGVGERVPYVDDGPLKANCWSCGEPEFLKVVEMEGLKEHYRYTRFVTHGLSQKFTGATPPWRV